MSKTSSLVTHRAWNILRLALMSAKKGAFFRKRLVLSLTELGKGFKKIRNSDDQFRALGYGDREFSFDKTPIIHVKMNRRPSSLRFKMPQIPCIRALVDFDDYEFEFDDDGEARRTYETRVLKDDDGESIGECDEGIDLKAEQFIAKFYEQMKLQRQISNIQ